MISLFAYAYERTALPASTASIASGAGSRHRRRVDSWGPTLRSAPTFRHMYQMTMAVATTEVPMSFRKKSGGAAGSHGANAVHCPAIGCDSGTVSIEHTIVYTYRSHGAPPNRARRSAV